MNFIFNNAVNFLHVEKNFNYKFILGHAYTIIILWSYGYQGIINDKSILLQILLFIYFACLLLFINYYLINDNNFIVKLKISSFDIKIFVATCLLYIITNNHNLSQPIVGDEFYYTYSAKRHEIASILRLRVDYFDNFKLKNLIYYLNILTILILGLILYIYLNINSRKLKAVYVLLIFISLRCFTIYAGGGGNPFGPLQLLPIWVSTCLIGVNDFAVRVARWKLMDCYHLIRQLT